MNRKGFTLIELLAVIAIISILTVMIMPGIVSMRKNILHNSLVSKVSMINTAAKEYGSDNIMLIKGDINDVNGKCIASTGLATSEVTEAYCMNECYIVLVKTLILNGYLAGDDAEKSQIMNPVTGESMNSLDVCIRFDNNDAINRKLVSYIVKEGELLSED